MKRILLTAVVLSTGLLAAEPSSTPAPEPAANEQAVSPEEALAKKVAEIASSEGLTPQERKQAIGEAVKAAISDAIKDVQDPVRIMEIATRFVTRAAQAAPRFAPAIVATVVEIPAIARIEGAGARIQTAVDTAVATVPAAAEFTGGKNDLIVSPSR